MPYGSDPSEARLRSKAAARITDEELPVICPVIIDPRHGSDEMCQVCGEEIGRYRIEYKVKDPRSGFELAFHLLCYRAWQFECRRLLVHANCKTVKGMSTPKPVTPRSSSRPW